MAENNQRIPKTSEADIKAMLRKTAYSLPNTPSDLGYTAEQIRRALYKGFIDSEKSVLSELDRVVDAVNDEFAADDEKITEESSARASGDESLGKRIDEEEKERKDADESLLIEIGKRVEKRQGEKSVLYGIDSEGDECVYPVTHSNSKNTVVLRDEDGLICVPAPYILLGYTVSLLGTAAINTNFADTRYLQQEDLALEYETNTHKLRIKYKDGAGSYKTTDYIDLELESAITGIETKEFTNEDGTKETRFRFKFGEDDDGDGSTQNDPSDWYKLSSLIDLSGYLEKIKEANKLYGTNSNGEQTSYTIEEYTFINSNGILGGAGSVVRRAVDGNLRVPDTPSADGHATSKKYVDNIETTIKKYIDNIETTIKTDVDDMDITISQYETDMKTALSSIIAIQDQYINGYPTEATYE